MNRPPLMFSGGRFRSPRPYNGQTRAPRPYNSQTRGPYATPPPTGFQWLPYTNYGPVKNTMTENNDEHWCETCDRGFPTADMLVRHKQQHEKCNIDGCQFVAHPKVITKHIQMQHSSGLYKKIAKLDNPEQIQKWREERKKKYPTRINIEKKAAECKEKIERGEKMALKQDRARNNISTDQPPGRRRTHDFNKKNVNGKINKSNINQRQNISSSKGPQPAKKIPKILPKLPSVTQKNKLSAFTGLLSICMDDDTVDDTSDLSNCNNCIIEEDEYYENPVEQPTEKPVQEPVLCGALSSLMCEYGSSDEEINEIENSNTSDVKITEKLSCIDRKHKDAVTIGDRNTNNLIEFANSNMKEDLEFAPIKDLASNLSQNTEDNNDSDSGPEEVKTVKINIEETASKEIPRAKIPPVVIKKSMPPRTDFKHNNRYKHKVPSTLLQKLLHKEIRQERNIMLQCIRYIKKMNYFENSNE